MAVLNIRPFRCGQHLRSGMHSYAGNVAVLSNYYRIFQKQL